MLYHQGNYQRHIVEKCQAKTAELEFVILMMILARREALGVEAVK